MKYAILYKSDSGNTEYLAERLYESLSDYYVELCNIDECSVIPTADFYFVGFGIKNGSCSMAVVNAMEQISDAAYALFVTCGFTPTDKYKEKLCHELSVWAPDEAEYVDMFLCQGRTDEKTQMLLRDKHPQMEDIICEMFDEGENHPNEEDFENLRIFAQNIISNW